MKKKMSIAGFYTEGKGWKGDESQVCEDNRSPRRRGGLILGGRIKGRGGLGYEKIFREGIGGRKSPRYSFIGAPLQRRKELRKEPKCKQKKR